MDYRMGVLLVMFDLPVTTEEDRRHATRFRKELLDFGFSMMQFSIYIRHCVTLERKEKYIRHIKNIAPANGRISCLFVTDKQWGAMETVFCWQPAKPHHKIAGEANPDQLTFW